MVVAPRVVVVGGTVVLVLVVVVLVSEVVGSWTAATGTSGDGNRDSAATKPMSTAKLAATAKAGT